MTTPPQPTTNGAKPLTPRQREVLYWIVEGLKGHEIAARLGISEKTVSSHREQLYRKLGVHNVAQLVRLALTENFTPAPARTPQHL